MAINRSGSYNVGTNIDKIGNSGINIEKVGEDGNDSIRKVGNSINYSELIARVLIR